MQNVRGRCPVSRDPFGRALYDRNNPDFLTDVGWGRDDFSLIPDGASRDIGGGVSVGMKKNRDGSYEVTVTGGKVAEFQRWCDKELVYRRRVRYRLFPQPRGVTRLSGLLQRRPAIHLVQKVARG